MTEGKRPRPKLCLYCQKPIHTSAQSYSADTLVGAGLCEPCHFRELKARQGVRYQWFNCGSCELPFSQRKSYVRYLRKVGKPDPAYCCNPCKFKGLHAKKKGG